MRRICFILLLFLVSLSTVYAKEKVTFSKCVDGDTIKIKLEGEEKTVRMLAVDTPESVHPTKGVEYYGKEASEFTCNAMKKAKNIELEYDNNSDKEDKYGRILAWIWVDDTLFQDTLIKEGYAEVAYLYGDYKYTSLLQDHQGQAEAKQIGIWNDKAREEFDSTSVSGDDIIKSNEESEDVSYDDNFKFEDMSTKEIIILIATLVILSIIAPVIKKWKRKLKKLVK